MHKHLVKLIEAVQRGNGWSADGEKITVSKTSRTAGGAYEKVRNAVEYEEEHLLRRNAIRRILRRRGVDGEEPTMSRGEALLHELIWAKYLPNKEVPASMIKSVDKILAKYDVLFREVPDVGPFDYESWLYDVASTEIEYLLDPPRAQEALATMMFDHVQREITWDATSIDKKQRDMLMYIAIHRALLKSNLATLRYRVFMLYFPTWGSATGKTIADVAKRLPVIIEAIEGHIKHPYADQLYRLMRRYALIFWAIGDVVHQKADDVSKLIADEASLKREINKSITARYGIYRTKRRRTVARAVLFLFITKMLLAIILEVPYDIFVFGEISWLAVVINVVFHPIFLAFLGMTASIPGKKNTQYVANMVQSVVTGNEKEASMDIVFKVKRPWTQGVLGKLFSTVYAVTFIVSYGVIAWFLAAVLQFTWLSIVLFLVFFSLVTFFGIKIRQSVREVYVVKKQSGIVGMLFDVFMLPVVRVGRWLSLRGAKLNVFLFFLDFIVEAPFKLAIEMTEGWIAFVREKKEEI